MNVTLERLRNITQQTRKQQLNKLILQIMNTSPEEVSNIQQILTQYETDGRYYKSILNIVSHRKTQSPYFIQHPNPKFVFSIDQIIFPKGFKSQEAMQLNSNAHQPLEKKSILSQIWRIVCSVCQCCKKNQESIVSQNQKQINNNKPNYSIQEQEAALNQKEKNPVSKHKKTNRKKKNL